jgi:lysozyme
MRSAGPKAKALIQEYEGRELNAYKDSIGKWTIGYGHTEYAYVFQELGLALHPLQANVILDWDMERAAKEVTKLLRIGVTQEQFDALVSFVFNLGATALARSTLLKKLNGGNYDGAANEFMKWVYAGDKPLAGLVRRRHAEKQLFLEGTE